MNTTRRDFVGTIALGTAAGVVAGASFVGKGARAQTRAASESGIFDNGVIQLNQNESARGPGPKTMAALRSHTTKRVGRGYPADHVDELRAGIANYYSVTTDNVQLATGSTPLLHGAVRAFCSEGEKFVTPMPTYSTSLTTARAIGAPTQELSLDDSLGIDLDALAVKAQMRFKDRDGRRRRSHLLLEPFGWRKLRRVRDGHRQRRQRACQEGGRVRISHGAGSCRERIRSVRASGRTVMHVRDQTLPAGRGGLR